MTERRAHILREAVVALLLVPLRLYQWLISPLFPPACRFEPTCSHYAVEALRVHGPLKGAKLAMRRLLRCHPFTRFGGSQGFDPVPPVR